MPAGRGAYSPRGERDTETIVWTENIARLTFWVSFALLAYVYVGYPLVLAALTSFKKSMDPPALSSHPKVTLIISAFNEQDVIAAKLNNALELDYPKSLLQVIVVSDSSTDATDKIVSRYEHMGVFLVRQSNRLGKSSGLNLGVSHAIGDILVFSDANALYQKDALRHLVKHFSNPQVGYVVGNARYVEKAVETQSAQAEGLYWKLETWLKKRESLFHSVIGGDGAIYAIRRVLYSPLEPTDISDFLNPLQIVDSGYLGVFEPAAVSYEETAESFRKEYRRKIRIVSRSLNALRRVPGVLNPFHETRHWFLLVSHKLLRWLAPVFMIAALISSAFLSRFPLFRWIISLQVAFYVLALLGWLTAESKTTWKICSFTYYFCLVNLASLVGCAKCLRGDLSGVWTPPRQKESAKA
jgi:cellulose synthase/poly-beta-1,6-N-acetylglucosamine synthase-like glycosyltransferase